MSSRRNFPSDHMYGGRSGRTTETRDGVPMSHLSLVHRRQSGYGAADNNNRTGRGKATADEDSRVVSRTELRVSSFLGGSGKSRASIQHNDQRALVNSSYAAISERRGAFRDDGMLKIVRGDDAPRRGDSSSRFRDGGTSRVERALRSAPSYEDEPKWFRNGNYDSGSYDGGVGRMRDNDYVSAKSTSSISAALPGFILECSKRTILNFSTQEGTFLLPVDDRRLAEQVAPGTKIFLMDANIRELHGVFQADSYAIADIHEGSGLQVRVRIAKECIPLTERQFKHIIHEDYYSNSKFTDALSKDQVMKFLGTFRPLDARRQVQLPLPSTRRTLDSGLSPSSPEFQGLSDEVVYRKDERWRRQLAESRSLGSHSYGQDVGRLLTKLPAQTHSKGLDDYEVYAEDELEEEIPLSSSRVVASTTLYSNSRSKQQALPRGLPGSRTGGTHSLGNAGYSELKSAHADWTDEMDANVRDYGKRRPVSSGSLDDSKRGDRSASPAWKDVVSRADEVVSEIYDRSGKSAYKEDVSYVSTRRHRHSEIDLNIPLDTGHGETENLHSMEAKGPRRRMWENDDEKSYSVTPPKGRSVIPRNSALRLSDRPLPSNLADNYEDPRLDSRHMVSVPRKDFPLMRSEEKGRSVINNYTNGKFGKLPQRTVPLKNFSIEKPSLSSASRKRPASVRDSYGQDSSGLRTSKLPFVKIKANVPQGKGQPTRIVTLVNSQSRPDGVMDRNDLRAWKSANADEYSNVRDPFQGRKKKASVWSRISLPSKGLFPKPGAVSQGRGRVFSRLGPSTNGEGTQAHQRKRLRMDPRVDSEILISPEGSPDALEGEDYLYDDPEDVEGDKDTEMAAEDSQGWTRKKNSVVADSLREEPTVPDHGDYTNAKGARRKLVRPSIGAKGQTGDNDGWKHLGSSSIREGEDLMDMEMANVETMEVVSPLASRLDLNSADKDVRPDLKEDNLLSL